MALAYIPIEPDLDLRSFFADEVPGVVYEIVDAMNSLYSTVGYKPPWVGYFAETDGKLVGTCAFKSPPENGRVEIAYATFPEFEGQGIAKKMAAHLIRVAKAHDPNTLVTAQTLPETNASTSILEKLNFSCIGTVLHPEDGPVWEWHLLEGLPPSAEHNLETQ